MSVAQDIVDNPEGEANGHSDLSIPTALTFVTGGYHHAVMDDEASVVHHSLLEGLTDAQRSAVTHLDGPALVLAGPGSGKTRVITRRVAYLIAQGVPAWSILAVTFTNKAAGAMRERVESIVPADVPGRRGLTITTFHAFCARLLRTYADHAGVPESYTIYDAGDQRSAIKQAIKSANMDSKNWSPSSIHASISAAKNQLIDAEEYTRLASDFYERSIAKVYRSYQKILDQAGALDFDDLLMKVAVMLRTDEAVRVSLQERYQYLLIDEYQDTNHVQFVLAHTLASAHRNMFVVGDPDQSIYGWRGADIRNILDFETHYPDAQVIALGQNFRSTTHIVLTADGLIRHNAQRKHKDLFAEAEAGPKPRVVRCSDEHDEARLIADELQRQHDEEGLAWKDMAVMYRTNALSRVIEDELRRTGVPYVIARGTAFYERAEIKDALAYVRVMSNPDDEISLRRIINTPTRGIGKTTLERLELFAYSNNLTLFGAIEQVDEIAELNDRAKRAVGAFRSMITEWRRRLDGTQRSEMLMTDDADGLADLVEMIIRESGLESAYRDTKTEEDQERLANLEELVSSASAFVPPLELGESPNAQQVLTAWLESIALVSDADLVDPENGVVTLMTLHASKGLEFPVVCIMGLEEGLLPHFNASDTDAQIEEERRLCFVGITRAMRHLLLTCAARRMVRGVTERRMMSHFLRELPEAHVTFSDHASETWRDPFSPDGLDMGDSFEDARDAPFADEPVFRDFHIGMRVRHPQFGIGRIESLERARDHTRSRIAFAGMGTKTLILEYARLEAAE